MATGHWRILAVLDFEATCADVSATPQWDLDRQEIIEVPVGLVSVADGSVVDSFSTLVRPVEQPLLTDFCTGLTSIRQDELVGQPTIGQALADLGRWLDDHDADETNTLVTTCGDWDLLRMWPKQAALVPDLQTPPLFQRWCNLKVVYQEATGRKRAGMMGMLRGLGLPHEGHHHRGADDVRNLCRVVIELLTTGAQFRPTWSDPERTRERKRHERKLSQLESAATAKRRALAELPGLPDGSAPQVRSRMERQLEQLLSEAQRLTSMIRVFT